MDMDDHLKEDLRSTSSGDESGQDVEPPREYEIVILVPEPESLDGQSRLQKARDSIGSWLSRPPSDMIFRLAPNSQHESTSFQKGDREPPKPSDYRRESDQTELTSTREPGDGATRADDSRTKSRGAGKAKVRRRPSDSFTPYTGRSHEGDRKMWEGYNGTVLKDGEVLFEGYVADWRQYQRTLGHGGMSSKGIARADDDESGRSLNKYIDKNGDFAAWTEVDQARVRSSHGHEYNAKRLECSEQSIGEVVDMSEEQVREALEDHGKKDEDASIDLGHGDGIQRWSGWYPRPSSVGDKADQWGTKPGTGVVQDGYTNMVPTKKSRGSLVYQKGEEFFGI